MTTPLRPVPVTVVPVPHGTAEALAVVAHLQSIPHTITPSTADELGRVYRPLLGPVDEPAAVFAQITDELLQLWRLMTADWDDADLDDLPDHPRYDAMTADQAQSEAWQRTTHRLIGQIEVYVWKARYMRAENARTLRMAGVA